MKTAFIIAEYNPFHNGHRYHIEQTRKSGVEAIIVLLSGNFVQRGDIAVADRFLRAECAVRCGADLVLELPVKYAVANASKFARGGVLSANACGLEGVLSFGASADPALLHQAVSFLRMPEVMERASLLSKEKGKSYPAALEQLLREMKRDELADLLGDPNNILGLEYIKAMQGCERLSPLIIERSQERGHDSVNIDAGFAGASFIRSLIDAEKSVDILQGEVIQSLIPVEAKSILSRAASTASFPVDRQKYELMLYARILSKNAADFRQIDNVSQGLENKLTEALRSSSTVTEALMAVKSKRYTLARLRQIVVAAALGITREDTDGAPSFLRVLAFNDTGRKVLARMRETAEVPVVTNLSDVSRLASCARDAELDYLEGKLFDLCLPTPIGGNPSFFRHPVCIRNAEKD